MSEKGLLREGNKFKVDDQELEFNINERIFLMRRKIPTNQLVDNPECKIGKIDFDEEKVEEKPKRSFLYRSSIKSDPRQHCEFCGYRIGEHGEMKPFPFPRNLRIKGQGGKICHRKLLIYQNWYSSFEQDTILLNITDSKVKEELREKEFEAESLEDKFKNKRKRYKERITNLENTINCFEDIYAKLQKFDVSDNFKASIAESHIELEELETAISGTEKQSRIIDTKIKELNEEISNFERRIENTETVLKSKIRAKLGNKDIDDLKVKEELTANYTHSFWTQASVDSFK